MQLPNKNEVRNLKNFKKAPDEAELLYVSLQEILDQNFDCSAFKNLWGIKLILRKEDQALPKWLYELHQLEYLSISFAHIEDLGEDFNKLQNLRYLDLSYSKMLHFPPSLKQLPQLEYLSLEFSNLHNFELLPKLKFVNLEYCTKLDMTKLLHTFIEMPKLEDFILPQNMSLKYSYGKEHPEAYYLEKFLKKLYKKKESMRDQEGISDAAIRLLPYLHLKKMEVLKEGDDQLYFNLLNCKTAVYRDLALEYLVNYRRNTPKTLKGKKLFLAGKLKIKKIELQNLIDNQEAKLVKKVKEADYLLLGEKAAKKLVNGIAILYEQDLWDLSDQAYLMEEENETSTEAVEGLLFSGDEDNVQLALQLMDKGGVPTELIEEVLGLMLFHSNNKIRKTAKLLFNRYQQLAPSPEALKMLKRQVSRIRDDKKVTLYIRALAQSLDIDCGRLAYAAYRYSNKEQGQGICLMTPKVSLKVMPDFIQYSMLYLKPLNYLAEGLYLETLPADVEEYIPELNKIRGLKIDKDGLIKDPTEFARLKGLKRAEISIAYNRKIPESIFENTDYEDLELTAYSAKKLPSAFGKLTNLKKLNLWASSAKKFPKEMQNIQQLEELSITIEKGSNFPDFILNNLQLKKLSSYYILANLPTELGNLKELTRLDLGAPITTTPLFLFDLPKLKSVRLQTPQVVDASILADLNQALDGRKLQFHLAIDNYEKYPESYATTYKNLSFK